VNGVRWLTDDGQVWDLLRADSHTYDAGPRIIDKPSCSHCSICADMDTG